MAVIKESSDELNPAVIDAGTPAIARAPGGRRRPVDYLALALATCGVGYLPLAPGTWGSAVGVGLYLIFQTLSAKAFAFALPRGWDLTTLHALSINFLLVFASVVTLVGIWAASRAETLFKRKDPGAVVIDEVAGQLIAFLFVPINAGAWVVLSGFVLFRLFDIWKPYPIRRLEALESGLGIMADDVLAGIYAAIVLSFVALIF